MLSTPSSSSHRHRPPPSERRDRHRQHNDQPPVQPAYEPPIAPLNTSGQQALAALLQTNSLRHLKTHLQHAGEKLTDSAGEVNERLTEARGRYEKEKRKKRARENDNGEEGEDSRSPTVAPDNANEELARLTRTEGKVKDVTTLLEEKMRGIVDAEVKIDGLTGVLAELGREAEQASVSGNWPSQRRRQGMRRVNEDEEEDGEEDEEDEDYEATPEREARAREIAPSRRLDEKLKDDFANWENLSLTQRYSTNNSYIGFYRIVHDAKHPGDDIPPLPHASTWFNHMEDPTSTSTSNPNSSNTRTTNRRTRRDPSPADSDEIAIERERISLKCPLTLLNYRDPVTSTKCPHSFEREAIFGMIAQSSSTIPDPAGGRNRRVKTVKCPVCSVVLTAEDLRGDPVLLRRVRRAEAAERQEEEEEDDDEDERPRRTKGGRKSGITVASDDEDEEEDGDDMDVDGESGTERAQSSQQQIRIKQERAISRGLSTAPDMMDDDED